MLKRILSPIITFLVIFLYFYPASAQTYSFHQDLNWQIKTFSGNVKNYDAYFLTFTGAAYHPDHRETPVFSGIVPVTAAGQASVTLQNEVFVPVTDTLILRELNYLVPDMPVSTSATELDHVPQIEFSFVPLRKNPLTGQVEELSSFTAVITVTNAIAAPHPAATSEHKQSSASALASGNWYKIGVTQTGIYKLDYNFIKSLGVSASADLSNVKIYGMPGGMLPQANAIHRDSDLVQNAVQVVQSGSNSYILFYAKGPTAWTYNSTSGLFTHQINYYSDTSYYFITSDGDPADAPKRILNDTTSQSQKTDTDITSFTAYGYHELDTITSITTSVKSGREWYGEPFTAYNTDMSQFRNELSFQFPQADLSAKTTMTTAVATRTYPSPTSFNFTINNNNVNTNVVASLPSTDNFDYQYANQNTATSTFQTPSTKFLVDVIFNPSTVNDLGWLNYVEFNVPSLLKYIPGQFSFRNAASFTLGKYHISNAPAAFSVWDVTDFHNVTNIKLAQGANEKTFVSHGNVLHEFVANDGSGFLSPINFGKVPNQNIHGMAQPDMVIVSYPGFMQAADSLAQYHRQHDGFTVNVVTPQQVYNEFSSGTQDISSIKDMMRFFYKEAAASGKSPRFLVLIGAASFDYKNRMANNSNFVPTYEGFESLYAQNSFCSDDYFALLADNEGSWGDNDFVYEPMQLSVGRFPVYNAGQAMDIVHKIERYNTAPSMTDWRNRACFVADDRESNNFIEQAETAVNSIVEAQNPGMNMTKLYLDATPEENTPAGQLFPQINTDIDAAFTKGCLFMDYIGHGGQQGWAVEKVLTVPEINAWVNPNNMPLLITATCQFGTFDDPTNVSAGELALLNPVGGAFSLFTTTREVDIASNNDLDNYILNNNLLAREPATGLPKYIGQIFIDAKNGSMIETNGRNFTLLGDPAVRLALPEYGIKLTSIKRDSIQSDTFKALSLMTISGEVVNKGNIMTNFNGDLYPTVFDKVDTMYTLGQAQGDPNDPDWPMAFPTQNSVIYKGRSTVTNGKFTFQFVVPKDISFKKGDGKISLYAEDGTADATGYSDTIVVGGSDPKAVISFLPPQVKLFMNDTNFVSGGMVNQNPSLVARVHSTVGINTLGSLGHDLTATLTGTGITTDGNTYVLDDYYTADKNSYQSGTITYPLSNLADGPYQLSVKVWDVADNSAEATTDFVVANSSNLTIDKIFNYPNPFSDFTTFSFEDNQPGQPLHVDIAIFDIRGQMVRDLQTDLLSSGDHQNSIQWNGDDTNGGRMSSGMYVYRLTVTTANGQTAQKSEKLLLVK